ERSVAHPLNQESSGTQAQKFPGYDRVSELTIIHDPHSLYALGQSALSHERHTRRSLDDREGVQDGITRTDRIQAGKSYRQELQAVPLPQQHSRRIAA